MFRTISTDEYQPASEESKEEAAEKAKKQWQDRHMTVTPYGYNSIVENNYSAPSQKWIKINKTFPILKFKM